MHCCHSFKIKHQDVICNINIYTGYQHCNCTFMPCNVTGSHVFSPRQVDANIIYIPRPKRNLIKLFLLFILLSLSILALKYRRGDTAKQEPYPRSGECVHSTGTLGTARHPQPPFAAALHLSAPPKTGPHMCKDM